MASQGPRQQAFSPLKAKSGKVCPLYSSSMTFLPPKTCPKKGKWWQGMPTSGGQMLISGSGQQAEVQDSRHSYHSRQRVARYARFILVPWHSYHQKYAQKRANSGKVCPHLVVISSSVQHSYHQVIDLGYAELNWANGGKVCLFFLFCFHCSQQVTFFIQHIETVSYVQKKNPRILPPKCFLLASSWSMIPPEVVMTM